MNLHFGKGRSEFIVYLLFFLLAFLATFLVKDHFFFWDTIQLGAKHALFFFQSDFQRFILPAEMDSGHPPLFGIYLAFIWKLFGKSLAVSHFAMLPFLFGIIFFIYKIGKIFLNPAAVLVLCLLLFSDPVLASQSILISPDIVLTTFFLAALWAILQKNKVVLFVALIPLALISTRGMMVVALLFFFDFFVQHQNWKNLRFNQFKEFKNLIKIGLPYLPATLFACGYLIYHFQETGWIGYHEDSPWAVWFERVDFRGFLKNLAVFAWRLLDFGRVFIWLILFFIGWKILKSKSKFTLPQEVKKIGSLLILCLLFLSPTLLIYKGLSAHRYLLPLFIVLNLLTWILIFKLIHSKKTKYILFSIAILGFLSGNCWIYPRQISQGWDSTLAHLPYYGLRNEMIDFIQKEKIPFQKIGTVFPNIGSFEKIELNGIEDGFVNIDFEANEYIFYSNIMNDFSDFELTELETNWLILKEMKKGGIEIILYKNPNI